MTDTEKTPPIYYQVVDNSNSGQPIADADNKTRFDTRDEALALFATLDIEVQINSTITENRDSQ